MIPLSKTMRMSDFGELESELAMVDDILKRLNGGDKAQHPLRRWEYAMAFKAFNTWNPERRHPVRVADHGCCTGMFGPLMLSLGHDVLLYEVWSWGNQQEYATWQMEQIANDGAVGTLPGTYKWINRPLGGLLEEDNDVQAAFCISTMEHIPNFEVAFRQMCRTVNPGGMLFMTTDSAEDENDHYIANNVRAGTMFNGQVYERLAAWGKEEGFDYLGGAPDWSWDESCRLVNNYGFASMALVRS